jgi:hypothetical protein
MVMPVLKVLVIIFLRLQFWFRESKNNERIRELEESGEREQCWLNRFGSVQFNRFKILEIKTKPNRFFFRLFNRCVRFFFLFWLIFFCFFSLIDFSVFLPTPTTHLFFVLRILYHVNSLYLPFIIHV